jgi:hypothetical protein
MSIPWESLFQHPDRRIDQRTIERITKFADGSTRTGKWTLSRDGKTLTINNTGNDDGGHTINDVAIWEKQF